MAPVDLAHVARLERALATAGDLAKLYNAPVVYVGVTTAEPSSVAHTPVEFQQKLDAFAADESAKRGVDASAFSVVSHDPTIELEDALIKALGDTDADLVVMASHIPGLADHLWPSNGGRIAAHAKASVFIVRDV